MKKLIIAGMTGMLLAGTAMQVQAAERRDISTIRVTFSQAVKQAEPSVVNIYAARVNKPTLAQEPGLQTLKPLDGRVQERVARSLGSGVIVKANGIVVTNLHVIEGAQAIKVVLGDGREFAAKQVGQDEKLDLAVLKLDMKDGDTLPAARFGNSETLEVGDVVLAIGNPFGIGQSVSFGIVSAVQRSAAALSPYARFIQTDAPINPGNSGGALVDSTGALVGVNSGIFSKSGASNGIGFAIPAVLVQRVVNDIVNTGRVVRPWFGAEGQAVTASVARELGMPSATGVQLTGVLPGSPAAIAGLQRGDVILKLGDGAVEDPSDLNEQILAMPNLLGKATALAYWRGGHRNETTVTLTAMPARSEAAQTLVKGYNPLAGVTIEALGPALNADMNLPLGTKGVAVTKVPDAPVLAAFGMPVKAGDIVMAINGSTIREPRDIQEALDSSRSSWNLRLMRDGKIINLQTQ